ncbi:MAG: cytochrome c3 family protein [Acidobacteriota bacterium]|nr:cytochrome c3 family protein [Acidobacteriota bacterium]
MKLKCVSCHQAAATGDLAGFPAMKQCQVCHVAMAERTIPSRRVYEVPDFVFFSHGKHAAAKAECHSCHGDVTQQAIVSAQQPVKMKWCVDCHKTSKAPVGCNTCHELGQ